MKLEEVVDKVADVAQNVTAAVLAQHGADHVAKSAAAPTATPAVADLSAHGTIDSTPESSGGGVLDVIAQICALAAGITVLLVYTQRVGVSSEYRAGTATNLEEEFAAYGLNKKSLYYTKIAKMSLAALMIFTAAFDVSLCFYPSFLLGAFMVVAVFFHLRRHDEPYLRTYPSMAILGLCAVVIIIESPMSLEPLGIFCLATLGSLLAVAYFKPESDEYYGELINKLTDKLLDDPPEVASA